MTTPSPTVPAFLLPRPFLEVIASFDDSSANSSRIFALPVTTADMESEAMMLHAIFNYIMSKGDKLTALVKISMCLYSNGCEIDVPKWIENSNGKYFFSTKEVE